MITKLFETIKCGDIIFQIWEDGEVTPPQLVTPEVQEYVSNLRGLYRCDKVCGHWEFGRLARYHEFNQCDHIKNIELNWQHGISDDSLYGLAPFKRGKIIPFNTNINNRFYELLEKRKNLTANYIEEEELIELAKQLPENELDLIDPKLLIPSFSERTEKIMSLLDRLIDKF